MRRDMVMCCYIRKLNKKQPENVFSSSHNKTKLEKRQNWIPVDGLFDYSQSSMTNQTTSIVSYRKLAEFKTCDLRTYKVSVTVYV